VDWAHKCFGPVIVNNTKERGHRFLEEAVELFQSIGRPKEEALALVDYVYGRPVGDRQQEIGGVMVTLAVLCAALGEDMHELGDTELGRVIQKIDKIRANHQAKIAIRPPTEI